MHFFSFLATSSALLGVSHAVPSRPMNVRQMGMQHLKQIVAAKDSSDGELRGAALKLLANQERGRKSHEHEQVVGIEAKTGVKIDPSTPLFDNFRHRKPTARSSSRSLEAVGMNLTALQDDVSRLLKKRVPDNFVVMHEYADSGCTMLEMSYGQLVNYCYTTTDGDSYLYKVNNKDKTLVELTYSSKKCQGIPDSVVDVFRKYTAFDPAVNEYGDCLSDYTSFTYESTYPSLSWSSNVLAEMFYEPDLCEKDKYFAYTLYPSDTCLPAPRGYYYYYIDTTACATQGKYLVNYHMSSDCSDDPWANDNQAENTCSYDRVGDDTFRNDQYYYTPYVEYEEYSFSQKCYSEVSGAPEAAATVAPVCGAGHPQWVGDGWCDSTYAVTYNTEECMYDGGDCCESTCDKNSYWGCDDYAELYDCVDPSAAENI